MAINIDYSGSDLLNLTTNKNATLEMSGDDLVITSTQSGSTPGAIINGTYTLEKNRKYTLRVTGYNVNSTGSPFLWIGNRTTSHNLLGRLYQLASTRSTISAVLVPDNKYQSVSIGVLASLATVGANFRVSRFQFFNELIEDPYEVTATVIKSSSGNDVVTVSSDQIAVDQLLVNEIKSSDGVLQMSLSSDAVTFSGGVTMNQLLVNEIKSSDGVLQMSLSSDAVTMNQLLVNEIKSSDGVLQMSLASDGVTFAGNVTFSGSTSNDITKSYVPRYIYEYANYSSSNVKSAILYLKLKNVSGGNLVLSGYQIWMSFKNSSGAVLAKPSTSTAFDPESLTEISIPSGTINSGSTYEYLIKLINTDYELTGDLATNAKYWSIGFRQLISSSGVTNVYQNNAIESFSITIIPAS